jgi:two-component system cell cycle sensor histidine kinase/response regulator CckA
VKTDSPSGSSILRILHLEDSPVDCALVQDTVNAADLACDFIRADNERSFLNALQNDRFDLILADYTLPGYNGTSALAAAQAFQPAIPFIFVSGTIGEEQAIEILKEGATDYVLKQRIARLVPAIRRALREAAERAERQRAEQALRDSEQRFREMAGNIHEVFWSASADGQRILYISPAYELVWNRSPTDLVARPGVWLESIQPEDRERIRQARTQLAQGRPYTLEYRITLPADGQRWIEERAYPVSDPTGKVVRSVGVALDITVRKNLEMQLQQAQKMDVIGQLAGGIAHDFSNMLTVINGYSNLLLDTPTLPPDIAEPLRQIYVAGGHAAGLTRQLLIFSRKSQPHGRPLDLNELIDEAATMLRRMIGEHINLQLDLAHPLPLTLADASMIEQILLNLVVNARDAMPKGGSVVVSTGSMELNAADCQRHPDARPGAYLCLSVQDTGSGIPPGTLPRIFEPFFTTKEAGKGTGLGLATVFGIAKQHQGWVEVESEVGSGTLFRVFLPIAATETSDTAAPSSEIARASGGKELVLLVEDEDSVRAYARTVLELNGYKVLEAGSGVDALEVWKWHRDKIALLLTDLVMPGEMTGLDLAEKLQADRPGLRVLFASGYNQEMADKILYAQSAYCFLHKPYGPRTLARTVREVIDHGTITARSASQTPFT